MTALHHLPRPAALALLSAALLLSLSGCAVAAGAAPEPSPLPPGRITNADPAMEYRPETATALVTADYTPEQITGAQRAIVRFVADEAIGPRTADPAHWWVANSARFTPGYRDEARRAAQSGDGELLLPEIPAGGLRSRALAVLGIGRREDGAIKAVVGLDYTYLDRTGASRRETGDATAYVRSDPKTGAWLIDGFRVTTVNSPDII